MHYVCMTFCDDILKYGTPIAQSGEHVTPIFIVLGSHPVHDVSLDKIK